MSNKYSRAARRAFFARCNRAARLAALAALAGFGLYAVFTGSPEGFAALAAGAVLKVDDYEEILEQIFSIADGAGEGKGDMRAALDEIADLADPETELESDGAGTWSVVESSEAGGDGEEEDEETR